MAISSHWLSALIVGVGLCAAAMGQAWSEEATSQTNDVAKKVRSQALINSVEGGAQAFTADPSGLVTHIQSGMVCVPGAEKMRLAGLMVNHAMSVGDDVGCDYVTPDGKTSVFATRVKDKTLQSVAAEVGRSIATVFPDARLTIGPMVATYRGLSTPIASSFTVTFTGKPCITSVWLAKEGDWLIEERATYPAASRHDPEFLAAMQLVGVQKAVHDRLSN